MRRTFIALSTLALLLASVLPAGPIASVRAVEPSAADRAANLEPADVSAVEGVERTPSARLFLGTGSEPRTYLIRLHGPAVPTYDGGVSGLAPTAPDAPEQLDTDAPSARAYRDHLVVAQVELVTRIERNIGRPVEVPFTYQYAVNGLAAVLTPDEAGLVADDPAVASITLDVEREIHTDVGPQWEGAGPLWNANPELGLPSDIKGEGIIIGTIDTGISPGNRSFADVGSDGYDHTNPLGAGNYLGVCNAANPSYDPLFPCNDKLIGAYNFIGNTGTNSARDYDGHGSHTASTSGGNVVNDVVVTTESGFVTPAFDISGVAPHANIIAYRGCCSLSGLTASIDQAIEDEVDVINYSIGSPAPSAAWDDFDTIGFLNARAAGIFVASSNGNDGPGDATTGSPADAPWLLSVGASTHNRHNGNALISLASSGASLADIPGKSVTGALPAGAPIVDATDVGDPLCLETSTNEAAFAGAIVICDRGVNGRVEKSQNVAAQGAAGFVLVNDEVHGDSLLGDEYAVPGVFITFDDGSALRAWLATETGHTGGIAGTNFVLDDVYGDIMASFSSRGPNRAIETIVPAVTAPGVDILAALGAGSYTSDVHGFISGTSMASPHAAGAGALLSQARPAWTPAQQQSALMTTARPTVLNHDGELATPYAQGSGHIDVGAAALAGLLFDETFANYVAANPDEGGDPKTLNLPSFANFQCLGTCSWERTATVPVNAAAPVPAGVTWTASTTSDLGLTLAVNLSLATLSPGNSTDITVSANVTGAATGETLFGRITLTPSNPAVPTVTMPVAVVPTSGVLPSSVDIETRRDAGSYLVSGIQSIALTDFTGSILGLVRATIDQDTLVEDPTKANPYDNLAQVDVFNVEVPAGASRLVAQVIQAQMPDLDLFVGTGTTPSPATEVCVSATGASLEYCDVPDPAAGTWWILIQNWDGTTNTNPDTYTLASAVVPGTSLGNAGIEGPPGAVPAGQPYDIRIFWNEPDMTAGDLWYGTAVLGSSPGTPGDIGSFPVNISRVQDDVAKSASVDTAARGDTVSYEITIQPNVTPEDLVYTIVDTVPDGMTIDPDSVTGGGVVDGQTITWVVDVPTAVGAVGNYVSSTPASNPQCFANAGFVDLATLGIGFAGLDGDGVGATAFSSIGPFEQYGQAFPNLVVTEDGFVTVTGGYGGQPWIPQVIPNAAAPNGVMALLWSDLELSLAAGRGMRLAAAPGVAVIQWDNPFEWTEDASVGPSVGKFQAWIYTSVSDARPEMTFDYGPMGDLPAAATVGIENILGTQATSLLNAADPSGLVTSGSSICLDYDGPSFDPITLTYDVTVDTDASGGTYTNAADHITDDPYAEHVVVSTDVEVSGPLAMLHVGTGPLAAGTGTSLSPAFPVGIQAGDLLLLGCQGRDDDMNWSASGYRTLSGPSDEDDLSFELLYAWATGAESGTLRVTNSTGRDGWSCSISAVRGGAGSGSPLDVAVASRDGRNATMTAPGVTTVTDGALVTRWYASADDNRHGSPSVGTLAFGGTAYQTGVGSDHASSMSYLDKEPAGATGTATMRQTANAPDDYIAVTVALRAGTWPPPPPPDWSHVGTGPLVAGTTTSLNVSLPSGRQAGDLLLLGCQGRRNGMNWSAPGYATLAGPSGPSDTRFELLYAWATGAEPGSVTVSNTTGRDGWSCEITALRGGVGSGSPLDVAVASQNGRRDTMTARSVTTVTDGALVTRWYVSEDDNSHGLPSVGTLAFGGPAYDTVTGDDHAASMSYLEQAAAGPTGTATMEQTARGADDSISVTVVLKPGP